MKREQITGRFKSPPLGGAEWGAGLGWAGRAGVCVREISDVALSLMIIFGVFRAVSSSYWELIPVFTRV